MVKIAVFALGTAAIIACVVNPALCEGVFIAGRFIPRRILMGILSEEGIIKVARDVANFVCNKNKFQNTSQWNKNSNTDNKYVNHRKNSKTEHNKKLNQKNIYKL